MFKNIINFQIIIFLGFICLWVKIIYGVDILKDTLFLFAIMLTFLSGLIGFHNRYDKSKVSENLIKWLGRQKKILWFAKEESRGTVIEYAAKIIMLLLIIAISLRLTIYKNEEMFLFYVSMAGRTLFISILSVHALLWSFGKVVIELRTGNTIKVIEDIAINMLFYACVLFTVGYFI